LEKQANRLQNKFFMKLFSATIMFTALFFNFSATAQTKKDSLSIVKKDTIITNKASFEKGKEYILGGITVSGLKKFSE
jgi:outer membrane protein insertion porin family